MKDLSNYFDKWITVETKDNTSNIIINNPAEKRIWCEENIGIRGLHWDFGVFTRKINSIPPARITSLCFTFKNDQDALMFILKFGGNIVQSNQ